jgi:hypothetical protein
MKRANIFQIGSKTIVAYLSIINEDFGRFNVYDIKTNNNIGFGNINGNRINFYGTVMYHTHISYDPITPFQYFSAFLSYLPLLVNAIFLDNH